jgi:phosphoribosylanthranilate isomerase
LPDKVETVGVFVEESIDEIRAIVEKGGLTAVQLHGSKVTERVWKDPRPAGECLGVSKVIPVVAGSSLENGEVMISQKEKIFALLIDAQTTELVGGTGTKFNWQATSGMVQSLGRMVPVIVAGGLKPANVRDALDLFQPFGVDVSSGVEATPGKKDPQKVRAFVQAVRTAEKRA